VLDELAAAFMEENPGIQVERIHFGTEDLRQQYRVAVLDSDAPEMVARRGRAGWAIRRAGDRAPPGGDPPAVDARQFFPGALAAARWTATSGVCLTTMETSSC